MTLEPILNENTFPGNSRAFSQLEEFLRQGQIIAFTGAGVSVPEFPTWAGLLSMLLREAHQEGLISGGLAEYEALISSDPLELAEQLEQTFTHQIFRARLSNIFRNNTGKITNCQKHVDKLNLKGIVTLNYDNGHEVAYASRGRNPNTGKAQDSSTLTRWLQGEIFKDQETPILHFHGDVSDPKKMIFTSSDYDRFYSESLPESFLSQLWRSHRLLVIGFGFSDVFLTRLAEATLRSLPSDIRHFALIGIRQGERITPMQRQIFAKKYRLTPVCYEVLEDDDHSNLLTILTVLSESHSSVTTTPRPFDVDLAYPSPVPSPIPADKDFQNDLFVAPNGNTLYIEPRFKTPEILGDDSVNEPTDVPLWEIVLDSTSYIISCPQEHGATTLARRLVSEFRTLNKRVLLSDATELPNYKKKLEEAFAAHGFKGGNAKDTVIILDNFDSVAHERLLKEILGTGLFERAIVLAQQNLFASTSIASIDQMSTTFKSLTLMSLRRADIRTLTSQFYESSDSNTISSIVEKVYSDLISLCIPSTPSNVVMYLTILFKEGDFQPLNRVEIVNKYLSSLLLSPSDLYRDVFTAKNKMDVLSAFTFHLYHSQMRVFSEADWFLFCRAHMKATLTEFDDRHLLNLLKSSRVLVSIGPNLYFKYRFFFTFLLGRYIATRPAVMSEFIKSTEYLTHHGLVEVIANLASDNEPLIVDIMGMTCPCKVPPRGVRVRPCEGRTNEASQVYGRADYWGSARA